jgi:hypothetical protein
MWLNAGGAAFLFNPVTSANLLEVINPQKIKFKTSERSLLWEPKVVKS